MLSLLHVCTVCVCVCVCGVCSMVCMTAELSVASCLIDPPQCSVDLVSHTHTGYEQSGLVVGSVGHFPVFLKKWIITLLQRIPMAWVDQSRFGQYFIICFESYKKKFALHSFCSVHGLIHGHTPSIRMSVCVLTNPDCLHSARPGDGFTVNRSDLWRGGQERESSWEYFGIVLSELVRAKWKGLLSQGMFISTSETMNNTALYLIWKF